MRIDRFLLACLVATFAFVAPAAAQALPAGVTKVTSVEGITEYRLANGLRVLLFPDASKPTITVNITYLVGSRHENYGETGMAHLLEHMLFKGTPKNPHLDQQFNQRGARSNGSTWLDRTNYYELFQASDDNLKWAIDLEADRMVHSNVARKDLDSEMTVVRNEYESGENSPFGVLIKRLQSVAYDWHSYGRSTIGNRSDIENVRIENLQAFYRLYYQPDNAVLLVAGKFDPNQYRLLLQTQNMTPAQFEQVVRDDLSHQMLPVQLTTSAIAGDGEVDAFLRLSRQGRNLRVLDIPPPTMAATQPTEAEIKAWYDAHASMYRTLEQVAVEYVELDAATLPPAPPADEQTLRARYESEKSRFGTSEQRLASHILVKLDAKAPTAAVAAAFAKAQGLVTRARLPGGDFASMAQFL